MPPSVPSSPSTLMPFACVVGGRLAVGEERAVHHHAREPELDRHEARLGLVAVVEVEHDRDVRRTVDGGQDEVAEVFGPGVRDRAARGLHDDGRLDLLRARDDALELLHVVDVERPDAVSALGGFVEDLAQCGKRHRVLPPGCGLRGKATRFPPAVRRLKAMVGGDR
jgi:hypothetical protein